MPDSTGAPDAGASSAAPVAPPARSWAAPRVFILTAAAAVAGLTLFNLGEAPPGLFMDEVAISLTARSLWETGEDLAGNRLPLFPLSFPDTGRPMPVNPVFVYGAIPFSLAGPGPWSARLPAVLWLWAAGAGIGLAAFSLTGRWEVGVAIGTSATLSPWLFVLGRVGWEAVSYPALTALAFHSLLRGLATHRAGFFAASGILFGASTYAYSTARLVAPLTAALAALVVARTAEGRRRLLVLLLPVAVCLIPLGIHLFRHPGLLTWRAGALSIWRDGAGPVTVLGRFLSNYAGYFSPRFLFLTGDENLRHGTGRGVLLWVWGPLLALGIAQAWRRRREPAVAILLAGLLAAPAGAAVISFHETHAIRSIGAVVFWGGLAALGLERALAWGRRGRTAAVALALAVAVESGLFLSDYFGPYRLRAHQAFDADLASVLPTAFAARNGRPLFVPEALVSDPRWCVFVPYWSGLAVHEWRHEGLKRIGVNVWRGEAPAGSLILVDASGPRAPRGAAAIYPGPRDPPSRYTLYEFRAGRRR